MMIPEGWVVAWEDFKIMETKKIKQQTSLYILAQENLSYDSKMKMLVFVEKSDREQVMNLLLNGSMEDTSNIDKVKIRNEFDNVESKLNEIGMHQAFGKIIIDLTKGEAVVGAAIAYSALVMLAFKLYLEHKDKFIKQCRNFKGPRKNMCIAEAKAKAKVIELKTLMTKKKLCNNSKNPKICNDKISKKIQEIKDKIEDYKEEAKKYEHLAKAKGKI